MTEIELVDALIVEYKKGIEAVKKEADNLNRANETVWQMRLSQGICSAASDLLRQRIVQFRGLHLVIKTLVQKAQIGNGDYYMHPIPLKANSVDKITERLQYRLDFLVEYRSQMNKPIFQLKQSHEII